MNVVRWVNRPPLRGVNKLTCFNILRDNNVSIPEYTTNRNNVSSEHTWLARHTVTGSGGRGITIINPGDRIVDAPLYVKYIPKKYEVRIHVSKGRAFDVQQKMFRRGTGGDVNHKIRSHGNGFIFVRHGLSIPTAALDKCKAEGIKAVRALGMDFGAVDVIFNEKQDKAYVLEINSSPGVENITAQNYATMLRGLVRG
jgi:glutathione synthase/RimK-type ligase-like ATP-grasp enzyme